MGKKSVTNEVRCQIIGLLKDKTKSNREIAKLVGVSEKCVRTTRKNNDIYGGPKESTKPGRPRKLTNSDQNSLIIQVVVVPQEYGVASAVKVQDDVRKIRKVKKSLGEHMLLQLIIASAILIKIRFSQLIEKQTILDNFAKI
ncbi:hypothetical protein BpHYR1_033548 [Brachionus plicatilis]|uniref:Homeodomain-like DNA binding domain-containing transcription factor n=1 Tax=Brachionus plicatilis TaxID=10195 RepID=A0A3M7T2X7_BRAPC|nr:hypothetical protein BpHYR1_033548 [Brachionus plicatilis]